MKPFIRVELPREEGIDHVSQRKITTLIDEINGRPLKCLGYQTPDEYFSLLTQ